MGVVTVTILFFELIISFIDVWVWAYVLRCFLRNIIGAFIGCTVNEEMSN